ncbi:hypothetical protein ABIA39_006703 [Nocardia sp. GAS34]|uniref:hypothetical protein n=1 Tax=unclassified Nocardia TaxID=2637762 RepID=UPI003D1A8324
MGITWFWGLAALLARSGIEIDDVYDLVSAWLAGQRPMRMLPGVDDATGLKAAVLMGRGDDGRLLVILARIDGPDLYVINAFLPTGELIAEHERWEHRND